MIADSGLPPLIAQLLYNRGFTDFSLLDVFLVADQRLSADPALLPGMHQGISRIYRALLSGENIAVYGDFDTDGITATALLVKGLSLLGCNAVPYIPHRLTEGYGLKTAALEKLHLQGINLVVTVDCGITALSQVKKARRMGLDIVITDHHTPAEAIPPATAVINPKLPESAFQSVGRESQLEELIDLVAVGTVADMVPLLGENRYLVKEGLKRANASPRLGIREIAAQSGINANNLDAEAISWTIAPRLNAAGRLEHAIHSYRLLMSDSPEEARELAMWLEKKNSERQRLTSKAFALAREQVLAQGITPLLIAADRDFPAGICGIVASRLSEEFYRPAIVIRTGEVMSSASCRSIPDFNIIAALSQCSRLFTHYGGHAGAAGFSMLTRNLPRLQYALTQIAAAQLEGVDLRPKIDIDSEVKLSDLGGNTFPMIQRLAPFGKGNPAPTFLTRRVEAVDCRTMGNGGEHIKLKLKQNNVVWDGVGFGLGCYLTEASPLIDIVFNLEVDRWSGDDRLRLNILDFAQAN
jgi:single-stranded-DNA-specific exonuclease